MLNLAIMHIDLCGNPLVAVKSVLTQRCCTIAVVAFAVDGNINAIGADLPIRPFIFTIAAKQIVFEAKWKKADQFHRRRTLTVILNAAIAVAPCWCARCKGRPQNDILP